MLAIFKREIGAYFKSPIGYVILAIYWLFAGIYFYATALAQNSASLTYLFNNMFIITIFVIPIVTMRLFSDEKRQKTDQLLLTSPISLTGIVVGKYLAALVMFASCLVITLLYTATLAFFAHPDYAVIFGNLLGAALLSAALISIGMFLSSLTENQIVAAVSGIAIGIFIVLLDALAKFIPFKFLCNIFASLSFMAHYNSFTLGVVSVADIIFFLSVCIIFNFLTIRVFEKKRWA